MNRNKSLSLIERWEIDIESYKAGAKILTSIPQCELCANYIKGNALHCKVFRSENKPKHVMFINKECSFYISNDPINIQCLDKRQNKILGGLFGFCVGDMLGLPLEFTTRDDRKIDPVNEMRAYGTYHQPFGTWSDDTSLMLCLIDAINSGYSVKKLADNFVKFYKYACFTPNQVVFDIGNATKNAIQKMCVGIEPVKCGGNLEQDNGNGSLMRVLPLAFYAQAFDDISIIKMIEEVSSLTHQHNYSKFACILYVVFAINIMHGFGKSEALEETIKFIYSNCSEAYSDTMKLFDRILNRKIMYVDEKEIKSTGYVVDTLEAVFWAFFNAENYKETVFKAINLGGDTDTIAAIAGGLAGINYGVNSIPDIWIQNLIKKENLYQMFRQFCEVCDN